MLSASTCGIVNRVTIRVRVRLPEADVAALDVAITLGHFANRSEALRAGLERILYEERQRAIDEAYAAGYAKYPQEEWVGGVGLAGLVAFNETESNDVL
jgi:Arc/MetJ-type ribon-helix-helix transcriptional regulator